MSMNLSHYIIIFAWRQMIILRKCSMYVSTIYNKENKEETVLHMPLCIAKILVSHVCYYPPILFGPPSGVTIREWKLFFHLM